MGMTTVFGGLENEEVNMTKTIASQIEPNSGVTAAGEGALEEGAGEMNATSMIAPIPTTLDTVRKF